jgi:hypothetical protein
LALFVKQEKALETFRAALASGASAGALSSGGGRTKPDRGMLAARNSRTEGEDWLLRAQILARVTADIVFPTRH